MDIEFKNWVKACLAIKCVRNGIIPLVEKHCNEHYSSNTDVVLKVCGLSEYSCNQCDVTELEPYHKNPYTKCEYRKCACKGKNMKPCKESRACGVMYDQIKSAHTNNDPNWSNTNCEKWSSSAWEQIKCYISTDGYKEKADISCADLTALIQICLNYRPLKTLFNQNVVDLDEVRRCRNDIYHSSTMKLSNDQLKYFLSTMKTFLMLNFFQNFKAEVDCQLEILRKLEKDEFEVSMENEIAARKDAMDGIQESIADMQKSFSQMKDQMEEINKRTADLCSDNREIKQHLSEQTKNMALIQETQISLSGSMSDLQTNIKESREKTDYQFGELLAKLNQLMELYQKQNPEVKEIPLQTETVTKINVTPENEEGGNSVSEEMCTAGNEIINSLTEQSADNPLKQRLKDVVGALQEGDNKVIAFKQKCLEMYIASPTVQSWMTLNKAFCNGLIGKAFLPLQTYLRTRHGCVNLTLTIELDQEYFTRCANSIIDHFQQMFNNQQTDVHLYKANERKEETQTSALTELISDAVAKTHAVNKQETTQCGESDITEKNGALFGDIVKLCNREDRERPEVVFLLGSPGAGKSSMINTIIKALCGKYYPKAPVGSGGAQSKTSTLKWYRNTSIKPCEIEDSHKDIKDCIQLLPNIIDSAGLEDPKSDNLKEILEMIFGGFIPPGTEFDYLLQQQGEDGIGCLKALYPNCNEQWKVTKLIFVTSCGSHLPTNMIECLIDVLRAVDQKCGGLKFNIELFVVITKYDLVEQHGMFEMVCPAEAITMEKFEEYEVNVAKHFNIKGDMENSGIRWVSYVDGHNKDNPFIENIALKFIQRMMLVPTETEESLKPVITLLVIFKRSVKKCFQQLNMDRKTAVIVLLVAMLIIVIAYFLNQPISS